jgi:hypothetical protein
MWRHPDANHLRYLARKWLEHVSQSRAPATMKKLRNWLEHDVIPVMGRMAHPGVEKTRP